MLGCVISILHCSAHFSSLSNISKHSNEKPHWINHQISQNKKKLAVLGCDLQLLSWLPACSLTVRCGRSWTKDVYPCPSSVVHVQPGCHPAAGVNLAASATTHVETELVKMQLITTGARLR